MTRTKLLLALITGLVLNTCAVTLAADVPGIADDNAITGKTANANRASSFKVDENGVVVDLSGGEVATLPPVVYTGDGQTVTASYSGGYYNPAELSGKRISLSVADVEMMALNYSWNLKIAMTQLLQARAKKIGAYGKGLPSLSAGTEWSAYQDSITGSYEETYSTANKLNYTVGLQQPLFLGGAIISGIKEADLYKDFVSEDIRRVRLAVIYTVRNQYYLCVRNYREAEIFREQMEISKEYWEKTKRRYEADDVAEIDVLRYEVDYKIQKAKYIRTENDYNVAVAGLLRLLGLSLDTQVDLTDPFSFTDYSPGDERSLTNEALQTRPEIRQSTLQEQMQEEKIWQAKSDIFPKVYAGGSWKTTNDYSQSLERRNDSWGWSAGINVKWDALAGGGQLIRAAVMNAEAILEQNKFTTRDTVDQVKQEVKDSLLNLYSSIDWVKSQQENVEQASRVLKQQTIRWDEGAGAYLDILDARSKLAETQLLYLQGVFNYKTAIVSLDYSIGRFHSSADSQVRGYTVLRSPAPAPAPEPTLAESFDLLPRPRESRQAAPTMRTGEVIPARIISEPLQGADNPAEAAENQPPAGPQPIF